MIPYESWAPPRAAPISPADKAVGRIAWGVIALVLLLIAFATASCSRNVGQPDARPNASLVSHPVGVDTSKARIPGFAPKSAIAERFTDAIGLSTPEGRARRQAVKLAKASVPRSIGKGAVYAPLATEVVNAYKPRAPVIKADSGATVTAIDKNKGAAATAAGATATNVPAKPFPWWMLAAGAAVLYVGYRRFLA